MFTVCRTVDMCDDRVSSSFGRNFPDWLVRIKRVMIREKKE